MKPNSNPYFIGVLHLRDGQTGFHLPSFGAGILMTVMVLVLSGLGATYFFAISYDDDYMITEEPEWTVNTLNRAQQSYYLKTGRFTNQMQDLQGYPTPTQGHLTSSKHYVYSTQVRDPVLQATTGSVEAVLSYGIPRKARISYRNGVPLSLHSVVGAVFLIAPEPTKAKTLRKERVMVSIVCQTLNPSNTQPSAPHLENGLPRCGTGTQPIAP